jgi:hypothetical protein
MVDSRAKDVISRQSQLETVRQPYEPVWRDVAEYCAPDAPEVLRSGFSGGTSDNQVTRTDRRTRRVYDTTVRTGGRRLAAGLESLITPQNEKWQGLTTAAMNDEETDEEKEWAEKVRDFLFSIRYSPGSGYVPAMQGCYANIVRFGPAYLFPEEDFSGRYVRYRSLPVPEVWIARNKWGEPDVLHRRYKRTARVAYQMFGDKLPAKIIDMAKKPAQCEEKLEFIQAICPNYDRKTHKVRGETVYLDGPFKSLHVVVDGEVIIKEKDFRSFPVACFNWGRDDGDDYGSSPTIELLTEVREISAVRKGTIRGLQGITDPALALGSKVDWLPPLDPGSRHPGLIDDTKGHLLAQPIITGARPDYAFQYIQDSRNTIQEGLYVNLFQSLAQRAPGETATAALIRQEEKGALLGPAGSSIQGGLAMQTDRELAILEAKGLYEPDSRFAPPASLAGKDIRVSFTSPLDILRKAGEARATIEVTTTAAQLEAVWPGTKDNIDPDEALRVIHSAGRAPQSVLRRREEVDADRAQRAKAAQAQAGMAAAEQAAGIAKDAVPAMAKLAEAGLMPGLGAQQADESRALY